MAVSKAQQRATNKYKKANYDRMELVVPKGRKDEIKALADTQGQSVNAYIISAVDEKMERDGGGAAAPGAGPVERDGGGIPAGGPQEAAGLAAKLGVRSTPPAALKAVQTATQPTRAAQMAAAVASFSPQMLETVQIAAEAAGESLPEFVRRAVETQAQRDKAMRGLKR